MAGKYEDSAIIALARKHGRIKERMAGTREPFPKETINAWTDKKAVTLENGSVKDQCYGRDVLDGVERIDKNITLDCSVNDQFCGRDMLDGVERIFDIAASKTSTVCDDLHFILTHKEQLVENTAGGNLPIPWHFHKSTKQFFEELKQMINKEVQFSKKLSLLQYKDWKTVIKNLQHMETLIQIKAMKVNSQLEIISHILKGPFASEDVNIVKSIVYSSDEELMS